MNNRIILLVLILKFSWKKKRSKTCNWEQRRDNRRLTDTHLNVASGPFETLFLVFPRRSSLHLLVYFFIVPFRS